MVQHVVIAIAMEAEANPLIERLGLTLDESIFRNKVVPFQAYSGTHNNNNDNLSLQVTVITNGKDAIYGTAVDNCGTVPAALATHLALDQILFHQSTCTTTTTTPAEVWLLNAGTCGGFQRKTAQIGDVFVTTAVAHHDRRIPIPQFDTYGIGKLSFVNNDNDDALFAAVDVDEKVEKEDDKEAANDTTNNNKSSSSSSSTVIQQLAFELGYKLGVCSTGNSLDATDRDEHYMEHVNDASVKDMEAAAVAWVCAMHNVPFVGIKVVTDIVDGDRPTQDEFMEHLHTAATSLQDAVPKVLDYLVTHYH